MNVSTAYRYTQIDNNISAAALAMQNAQEEVSTGKLFNNISQNPVAAVTSLSLQSLQNQITQYNANLAGLKSNLGAGSSALSSMSTLLDQANSIAVAASNGSQSTSAMTAYATQISSIEQSLVGLANTQGPDGQYVFGGQKNNAAPFTASGNTLTFNGDTNNVNVEVGPGTTIPSNVDISGTMTTLFSHLEALKSDIQSGSTANISKTDLANIRSDINSVSQTNGAVGVTLDRVSQLTSENTTRLNDLTTTISNTDDANVAQAASQLQLAQNTYQAALSASSIGLNLGLVNFMPTTSG
jgi:flagellar hook-associated protein 3 FlgL